MTLNTKPKTIAVDVDLTIVDTLNPWIHWLQGLLMAANKPAFVPPVGDAWKIGEAMDKHASACKLGTNVYEFWRNRHLYRDLPLVSDQIVPALQEWHQMGARVVFVSQCDPDHMASKIGFLHRNCGAVPFGFVHAASHDKNLVDYDVIIDDNAKTMLYGNRHRPDATHILYNQFNGHGYWAEGATSTADNWQEVRQVVGSILVPAVMPVL